MGGNLVNIDVLSLLMGKALGSGGGGGGQVIPSLPAEYQQVEYLEANGDAWSYVKFGNDSSLFLEAEFEISETAPDTEQAIIGLNSEFEIYYKSGQIAFYGNSKGTAIDVGKGQKYKVTAKMVASYPLKSNYDIMIGSYTASNYHFIGKIFSVVNYFEQDNIKIICSKFVPCKRKSDNVAGWYELFGGHFYAGGNGTTWTAGPDVN